MKARLIVAGLAVVLSASACGSSNTGGDATTPPTGSTATTGATPAADCSATAAPTPAPGITAIPGETLLSSQDAACSSIQMTISSAGISPEAVPGIPAGGTVAFNFTSDILAFRIGLENPHAVAAGTTLVYKFTVEGRYNVTINGPVVALVTVGNPQGGPGTGLVPGSPPTAVS